MLQIENMKYITLLLTKFKTFGPKVKSLSVVEKRGLVGLVQTIKTQDQPEPAWARLSLARPTRPARRARRTRVRRPELSLIGRLARTAARPKLKTGACSRLVPKVPHPLITTKLAHSATSGLFSWTCHSESVEASSGNQMQVWASLTKRITVCR